MQASASTRLKASPGGLAVEGSEGPRAGAGFGRGTRAWHLLPLELGTAVRWTFFSPEVGVQDTTQEKGLPVSLATEGEGW